MSEEKNNLLSLVLGIACFGIFIFVFSFFVFDTIDEKNKDVVIYELSSGYNTTMKGFHLEPLCLSDARRKVNMTVELNTSFESYKYQCDAFAFVHVKDGCSYSIFGDDIYCNKGGNGR